MVYNDSKHYASVNRKVNINTLEAKFLYMHHGNWFCLI
jgi:hypothetical protein